MRARTRNLIVGVGAVGIAALAIAGYRLWQMAEVGAALKAKLLCSGVFVSGRVAESVEREDMLPELDLLRASVDDTEHTVTVSALGGLVRRTAVHREGLGCTLAIGADPNDLRSTVMPPRSTTAPTNDWPTADAEAVAPEPGTDLERLQRAVDEAFQEPDPALPRDTRAVLVVHRGRILAERYRPGFDASTPQLGWSMTKSLLNALIGIRVGQQRLDLTAPLDIPEWDTGDPRSALTLDHLLRMSSGLDFDETYQDLRSDVVLMLFATYDTGALAASKALIAPPGTRWQYSSGTSNLLSRVLRHSFDEHRDYLAFPRTALFDRIGMQSAIIEPDPSGTFVGSSFSYATARDWARFGLLYLNDGTWAGERILPEGWVQYSTTPAPRAPQGLYGAHFWLNAGDPDDRAKRTWPRLPTDMYLASGFDGQWLVVIPSRDLVVVRLGRMPDGRAWSLGDFLYEILAALP